MRESPFFVGVRQVWLRGRCYLEATILGRSIVYQVINRPFGSLQRCKTSTQLTSGINDLKLSAIDKDMFSDRPASVGSVLIAHVFISLKYADQSVFLPVRERRPRVERLGERVY